MGQYTTAMKEFVNKVFPPSTTPATKARRTQLNAREEMRDTVLASADAIDELVSRVQADEFTQVLDFINGLLNSDNCDQRLSDGSVLTTGLSALPLSEGQAIYDLMNRMTQALERKGAFVEQHGGYVVKFCQELLTHVVRTDDGLLLWLKGFWSDQENRNTDNLQQLFQTYKERIEALVKCLAEQYEDDIRQYDGLGSLKLTEEQEQLVDCYHHDAKQDWYAGCADAEALGAAWEKRWLQQNQYAVLKEKNPDGVKCYEKVKASKIAYEMELLECDFEYARATTKSTAASPDSFIDWDYDSTPSGASPSLSVASGSAGFFARKPPVDPVGLIAGYQVGAGIQIAEIRSRRTGLRAMISSSSRVARITDLEGRITQCAGKHMMSASGGTEIFANDMLTILQDAVVSYYEKRTKKPLIIDAEKTLGERAKELMEVIFEREEKAFGHAIEDLTANTSADHKYLQIMHYLLNSLGELVPDSAIARGIEMAKEEQFKMLSPRNSSA